MAVEEKIIPLSEVQPGDVLTGSTGPTQVLRVYEEHTPARMYRLEFEGGVVIEASGNHLWYIETDLDRGLHRKRIKDGKRLFKSTSSQTLSDLEEIAMKDEVVETRLIDMLDLFGAANGVGETAKAIIRVAESIGHIVEENTVFQDMGSGEEVEGLTIRLYDARMFAQQILALHHRRYRKRWPLVVGSVVTTDHLSRLAVDVDIPEVREHKWG